MRPSLEACVRVGITLARAALLESRLQRGTSDGFALAEGPPAENRLGEGGPAGKSLAEGGETLCKSILGRLTLCKCDLSRLTLAKRDFV